MRGSLDGRLLWRLAWRIGAGVIAAAVAVVVFAPLGWPFELAVSTLPQIAAGCGVVALVGVFVRQRAPALALGVAACLAVFGARERLAPPSTAIPTPHARLVWANLLHKPEAFARVMALAAEVDADAVLIAEPARGLTREARARLAGPFAHQAGQGRIDGVNVVIHARAPLLDTAVISVPAYSGKRGLTASVQTGAGVLRVAAIHPPVPLAPDWQAQRDSTLRAALALAAANDGPMVLVGDFNTTPWSRVLRDVERQGGVRRASLGPWSTWMAPLPVLGLPIDHAYAAGGADISARLGPWTGSDHRPLIVDVALPQSD